MEEKLVEFANLLRQNGVRVSLAETLDALDTGVHIGLIVSANVEKVVTSLQGA